MNYVMNWICKNLRKSEIPVFKRCELIGDILLIINCQLLYPL